MLDSIREISRARIQPVWVGDSEDDGCGESLASASVSSRRVRAEKGDPPAVLA